MERIDYRKVFQEAYGPAHRPTLIDVPPMDFLAVDGGGAPGRPGFQAAAETLLGVVRTLRRRLQRGPMRLDFSPMPLEVLWWHEAAAAFEPPQRACCSWRLMVMQPPVVDGRMVMEAIEEWESERTCGGGDAVRLLPFAEGRAVQLHCAGTEGEASALAQLALFVREQGLQAAGPLHEIPLSGRDGVAPEHRRTLLRYAVRSGSATG